jgi:hypothetical protein
LSAQVRPAPVRSADASPRRQYSAPSFLEAAGTGEGGPAPQRYASAQPGGSAPAWPTPVLDERQNNYPSHPPAPPPAPMPRPAPNQYQPQNNAQSPGFTLVPQGRPLGRPPVTQQQQPGFDAVTAAVNALKDDEANEAGEGAEPAPPVRSQPARTGPVRQAQAPTRSRPRQTPEQANPSRAWVQVATGSNRAGLLFTYGQFRRRAGALLNGRAAYAGPNRLLVGPFPNEAAANSFARQLSARGVPSHSWTSDAGQRIDQLQAAASSDDTPAATRTRTAANERSSGTRNARGGSGSRNERNANSRNGRNGGRDERSAGNGSGRNRNGTTGGRNNGRNERTAGNSGRNGTSGTGRNGRNTNASSRTAGNGNGHGGSGRSAGRGTKPSSTASARSSRGGSSGQSRSSTRRGR